MKILVVGPKWIGGWLEGVERSIRILGHNVLVFPYDTPNAPNIARTKGKVANYIPKALHYVFMPLAQRIGSAWEHSMNQRLISTSNSFQADVVLILKGEKLQIDTLEALRAPGRCIISWWVDDPILYFQNAPQVLAQLKLVDVLLLFDRGRFDELASIGVSRLVHLPCAFDPLVYYPKQVSLVDQKRFRCQIGLVANYYPERGALLKYMHGLDVSIWGMDWKKATELKAFPLGTWRGKALTGAGAAAVYNVANICPNVHHYQSRDGGLNMRTYEIPAAGGFEITDYIPGMDEQFEIGSEMIVYRSPEHFRELAEYYLNHPEERREIAKRGRNRVLRDHTYEQRMKSMFEVLK